MIELPTRPQTAEGFVALMDRIWQDRMESRPDGGVILYASAWYDSWHNARKVLAELGARKLWANKLHGESGYVYQFPDGSRVTVTTTGGACTLVRRHAA